MKTLLLDFGGTLDADGVPWIDRYRRLYREAGIPAAREAFEAAFHRADDGLAKRHALAGLGLEETLRLQARAVLEILAPDRLASADSLVARFIEDCRGHFRRNLPVLERLRRRFRLGIVSNYYGNLESCLRAEGLRDAFDHVADSGVVGAEKPDPAIFLAALRALDGSIEEALMVGDSIPRDMRGAEGLGLAHAWVSANGAAACCPKALRLSSFPQLETLLP